MTPTVSEAPWGAQWALVPTHRAWQSARTGMQPACPGAGLKHRLGGPSGQPLAG